MNTIKNYTIYCSLMLCCWSMVACKKDKFNTTDLVVLSRDTLKFDTVFTSLGSTTKYVTIRNPNKEKINIGKISLAQANSYFRINVDGDTGRVFYNIEIPPEDSIYVFVEVTIDPNSANLPFLILDELLLDINNQQQGLILQAYGQNAHFYDNATITTSTTWSNDLPYVVLNSLHIDALATLHIEQGCIVYFGGNSGIFVEGGLTISGINDTSNAVTFRGHRLDKDINNIPYDNYPGQWLGVFFLRGSFGTIDFLNLRGSLYGINVGNIITTDNEEQNFNLLNDARLNNGAHLSIKNSKLYNNSFYGLFGFLSTIEAENLLCYGAGTNVIGLNYGGHYVFTNCTFYMGSSPYLSHVKTPVFYNNNFLLYSATAPPLNADSSYTEINNCIVYGSLNEELLFDGLASNPHLLHYRVRNSCIKNQSNSQSSNPSYSNCIISDPQFENIVKTDFRLKSSSPCIDAGNLLIPYTPIDIKGNTRTGNPDMGVVEYN